MLFSKLRWTGFFFAISAFNNSGMSILDANLVGASGFSAIIRCV
jgi:Trk-type K+ transport system membrane component